MHRFFIDKIEDPAELRGDEHNHLAFVLRAGQGERVILSCGGDFDYIYEIEDIKKDRTKLRFVSEERNLCNPKIDVTFFMSVLKSDKTELLIQKATELGIGKIIPLLTGRTQVKKESLKLDRLRKIAQEACKQSGRNSIPVIEPPIYFRELAEKLSGQDLVVFAYEKAKVTGLKAYLENQNGRRISKIAYVIGPEGGFSEEEADELAAMDKVTPISLGNRIMRAETAGIAVLSVLMYEFGEWERA